MTSHPNFSSRATFSAAQQQCDRFLLCCIYVLSQHMIQKVCDAMVVSYKTSACAGQTQGAKRTHLKHVQCMFFMYAHAFNSSISRLVSYKSAWALKHPLKRLKTSEYKKDTFTHARTYTHRHIHKHIHTSTKALLKLHTIKEYLSDSRLTQLYPTNAALSITSLTLKHERGFTQ